MIGAPRTDCAVDAAMSVIEGRWKTVILCKLYHSGAPMRYNQLMSEIDGISPRIFTLQLKEMERDGLIIREEVSRTPKYVVYSLSEKGSSLIPILAMLAEWGLRHMFPNMVDLEDMEGAEKEEAGAESRTAIYLYRTGMAGFGLTAIAAGFTRSHLEPGS